jgi:iron complex outermembrane receptor protein
MDIHRRSTSAKAPGLFALTCALVWSMRAMRARGGEPDTMLPPIDVPTTEPASPMLPSDPKDPTAFVTEIFMKDRQGEIRSTAELLASAPGATIHRLGNLGQLATVSLRGASSDQVLVLLDGVPLTSAALGTVDLSTIPAQLIDHIEVLRGLAGAFYGAGALGGVVNIVSVHPKAGEASAQVTYGEWNTLDASAFGALGSNDPRSFSGVLGADVLHTNGDFTYRYNPTPQLDTPLVTATRQNNQALAGAGLASAKTGWGPGQLQLIAQGGGGNRGIPGPYYAPTPFDHESFARGLVAGSWTAPRLIGPVDVALMAQGRVDSLDLEQQLEGTTSQLDVAGGGSATFSAPIWQWHRVSAEVGGGDESLSSQSAGNPSRGSFFAALQDDITPWRWLEVVPAVRMDLAGQFLGASPSIGAAVFPLGSGLLELRANAGFSFRAPSFAELYLQQGLVSPNPDLTPEHGQSVDFGAALSVGPALFSVTGFVSKYEDLIIYEIYPPFRAKPFNEGLAVIQGVEAEAVVRPWPFLSLVATGTYLDAFDDDPSSRTYGDPLPYRPPLRFHGRLSYDQAPVRAAIEADIASGQPLNNTGSLVLPGHAVFDASVGVRVLSRPVTVWLNAEVLNLTNDQAPDIFGYPLPGTAFFASIDIDLKATPKPQPKEQK